jgi:hypothetical protein
MSTKVKTWELGRLVLLALVIMMTIGLFPAPGFSGTYTIYPTDDASVMPTQTDNSTYWYICGPLPGGSDCNLYVKFDLSSIPANAKITNATLRAYCDYVFPDSGIDIQIYAVSDTSWTETAITWANKPAYGALLNTTKATIGWTQWVIGKANIPTNGPVSFMLMATDGVGGRFYSKDNPTDRPYLLVTTATDLTAIQLLLDSD